MWAAAKESPTTAAEKNSFDRRPRNVNVFASCNCWGCDARYKGSAAGSTSVIVNAVNTEINSALPSFSAMKLA